jgi:hypothetical protein
MEERKTAGLVGGMHSSFWGVGGEVELYCQRPNSNQDFTLRFDHPNPVCTISSCDSYQAILFHPNVSGHHDSPSSSIDSKVGHW